MKLRLVIALVVGVFAGCAAQKAATSAKRNMRTSVATATHPTLPYRVLADLDADGDVDGADYGLFTSCFNGTGNRPACDGPLVGAVADRLEQVEDAQWEPIRQMILATPLTINMCEWCPAVPNKSVRMTVSMGPLGTYQWTGVTDANGLAYCRATRAGVD